MTLIIVAVLAVGYVLMATEQTNHISRAAVAMICGVVAWLLYMLRGGTFLQLMHADDYNAFLAGDYETASNEIKVMKAAIDKAAAAQGRPVVLKVILETGLLVTPEKIADASFLAMEAGADFIKTSTGKVEVNATPTSAYIMCECIKAFYEKTGRKVGFKAAGGISNSKDALCYYCIGKSILGAEWMNKDLFRYGVSRLGNSLMSAIEQKTINFF
jgi:deoxyribose-phosphate aldolase